MNKDNPLNPNNNIVYNDNNSSQLDRKNTNGKQN